MTLGQNEDKKHKINNPIRFISFVYFIYIYKALTSCEIDHWRPRLPTDDTGGKPKPPHSLRKTVKCKWRNEAEFQRIQRLLRHSPAASVAVSVSISLVTTLPAPMKILS